jgi:hypothetical protein
MEDRSIFSIKPPPQCEEGRDYFCGFFKKRTKLLRDTSLISLFFVSSA